MKRESKSKKKKIISSSKDPASSSPRRTSNSPVRVKATQAQLMSAQRSPPFKHEGTLNDIQIYNVLGKIETTESKEDDTSSPPANYSHSQRPLLHSKAQTQSLRELAEGEEVDGVA